jgi:hypothetical protein
MLCISRYTDDTYAQQFGDGHHKFYLEFRCNRPCLKNMDCCAKCAEKSDTKLQTSRKFNHGNVNEPIPDNSHIFGGKWYYEAAKKWSPPPSEIIEFALAYQKEARGDFTIEQPDYDELSKAKKQSLSQEMARSKKVVSENGITPVEPVKRSRKPKVAQVTHVTHVTSSSNDVLSEEHVDKPVKRTRKPKVAVDPSIITTIETVASEPKKRVQSIQRKKAIGTPYSTLISSTPQLVHKEVSLPTHIETKLEEVDIDGYKIEYVKLAVFEVGQATYFRDSVKNKLYKKIKEKGIGAYIGRWNPDTDSIIADIPDSDNEN